MTEGKRFWVELTATNRGFPLIEFLDLYGHASSLQQSSIVEPPCVWFGTDTDRMHLTQEMVTVLLPYLQEFAKTGQLDYPHSEGQVDAPGDVKQLIADCRTIRDEVSADD